MTSAAWPHGLTDVERGAFVKRFARFVGMRWRQSRIVEQQSMELRVLQDVLELRSIIDSQTDEPLDALKRFASAPVSWKQRPPTAHPSISSLVETANERNQLFSVAGS